MSLSTVHQLSTAETLCSCDSGSSSQYNIMFTNVC